MSRFATGASNAAVVAIIGLILTLASSALATEYLVDTLADTSGAKNCSLRDAINASQDHPAETSTCKTHGSGQDTIHFAPALAGGTISLNGVLPQISQGSLTITGPSEGVTINGGTITGYFVAFGAWHDLEFSHLTFTGGKNGALLLLSVSPPAPTVTFKDCTLTNIDGTAIQSIDANVLITNCTFSGDGNPSSPTVISDGGDDTTIRGSIFQNSKFSAVSSGNNLTITDSTFKDNRSGVSGRGVVSVDHAVFSGNHDVGMFAGDGTTKVNNSIFDGNGGGIFNHAPLQVTNTTFSNNSGPGIVSDGSNTGKALATIINSTFSGNGGALANTNGVMMVSFCTFANNGEHTIYTYNNMVFDTLTNLRGNIMLGNQNCYFPFPPFRYFDWGSNIANDNSCPFTGTSSNNTDPQLDPAGLKDNGGLTPTIALQNTSPAIADAPLNECAALTPSGPQLLKTDQRGYGRPARVHSGYCSAGAYEFGAKLGRKRLH